MQKQEASRRSRPSRITTQSDSEEEGEGAGPKGPIRSASCPSPARWWHVPDQKIEEMIRGLGGDLPESPVHEMPTKAQRTVHFEKGLGPDGDALDQLMRRSFTGSARESWRRRQQEAAQEVGKAEEDEWQTDEYGRMRRRKKWEVSEEQLLQKIADIANTSEQPETTVRRRSKTGSAGLCALGHAKPGTEDKLTVNIMFIETGDILSLRVPPDLRLGPAKPPKTNAFTELFGQGASTKGFDAPLRSFDYKSKSFGSTQRPGWSPQWSDSLKERICKVTNIAPARQRLFFRLVPLCSDDLTLRSFQIQETDMLQMRVEPLRKATENARNRAVTLACTKRKHEVRARQKLMDEATQQPGNGVPSLRVSPHIRNCKVNGDVRMMPKWISQENPQLFDRVGIAIDGHGHHYKAEMNAAMPIYLDDRHDRALRRVRDKVA